MPISSSFSPEITMAMIYVGFGFPHTKNTWNTNTEKLRFSKNLTIKSMSIFMH
jgi:hypothetical protein